MRSRLIVADAVRTPNGIPGDSILTVDGRVAAIGDQRELRRERVPEERYPGGIIVPGVRDAHFHPVTYAAAISGLSLKMARDLSDLGERLGAAGADLAPGAPLIAVRLDDASLSEGRLPTRDDLDAVLPDRPVLVHRYCGHIAVANTAALDLAGVGPATPDPAGGSLDRDDTGLPTGVLRETAVGLVGRAISAATPPHMDPERFIDAMTGLAGLGLTSLGAIAGCGDDTWADLGDQVELICDTSADLPIRLNVLVIAHTPAELESAAEKLRDAGPMVRFLGLKAFSDGSLGGHTAAMHGPFADHPGTGTLRLDQDWGLDMARAALAMDGTVAIHAIGDRANAEVLDLYTRLLDEGADRASLRVEHASVLGDAEMERFAATGVTASVQPAFLPSETGWLEKRLGSDRLRFAYPFRALHEAGVPLAGGSDCPVEQPNPWSGMAAARDRAGITPNQGLDPAEAFALFTDWAARSLREPEPLGAGAPADFAVVDRDPVTASPDELRDTEVLATWVGGHPVDVPPGVATWHE